VKIGAALLALALLVAACSTSTPTTAPPSTPADSASSPPATASAAATTPVVSSTPTGSAGPPPTGPPIRPTPAAGQTPPPGAVNGRLTIWADSARSETVRSAGANFTARTREPVRIFELDLADILPLFLQYGPLGGGPDVIVGAHDWLGQLVPAGLLQPLSADLAASVRPVALDAFSYDGKLYGLPYLSQAAALIYNKDLVPNGQPPNSWQQLKTIAQKFQGNDPAKQGLCLPSDDPYHSYPLLSGFGGYVFGRNGDGSYNAQDLGLDSAGGLAYADELDSLVKANLLRDNVDYAACLSMLESGQTVFFMTGPWALADLNQAHTDNGLNFGVAPLPTMAGQPRPFVNVQGFMISANAPNALQAQDFLTQYLATDDVMQRLWQADPRLPTWNELADSMTDPNFVAFIDSADTGDPIPAIPEMSDVWGPWTAALDQVFTQSGDPQAAFSDAAAAIRSQIGQ
jgi:maltose-binding protein MalE